MDLHPVVAVVPVPANGEPHTARPKGQSDSGLRGQRGRRNGKARDVDAEERDKKADSVTPAPCTAMPGC